MVKEQHTAHYKTAEILGFYTLQNSWYEWQVMNEKINSNSMRKMYKINTSVLIQERAPLNVSKNHTICSLMDFFSANVMNEQWQIINLISWKCLFKNPWSYSGTTNTRPQRAFSSVQTCVLEDVNQPLPWFFTRWPRENSFSVYWALGRICRRFSRFCNILLQDLTPLHVKITRRKNLLSVFRRKLQLST